SEIMERARSDAKKHFFLNMSETVVYDDRGRVVASRSPLDPAGILVMLSLRKSMFIINWISQG
ncbi:hypothetical protein J4V82_27345, partial [Escherichia coli]